MLGLNTTISCWAKVQLLKEGDLNSKFFHAKASKRRNNNWICGLENENCDWVSEHAEISHVINQFYGNLFKANDSLELSTTFTSWTTTILELDIASLDRPFL